MCVPGRGSRFFAGVGDGVRWVRRFVMRTREQRTNRTVVYRLKCSQINVFLYSFANLRFTLFCMFRLSCRCREGVY